MATPVDTPDDLLRARSDADSALRIARLREEDPVHWLAGLDGWLVTRHDDVRQLFEDPRVSPDRTRYERYRPPPSRASKPLAETTAFLSAPKADHTRRRRLVSTALTPRAVARIEDQVRAVVDQFAAPLQGRRGVVDLFREFVTPIPVTVIGRITGVPPKGDDEVRFRELAIEMVRGVNPLVESAQQDRSERAGLEMFAYLRELAVERRKHPKEDLLSDLAALALTDARTSDGEIVRLIGALLSAGTETTIVTGTRALKTLLSHPDQLELLRREPSLLPNAVLELLRYESGLPGIARYALEDFELRGREIRKGQILILSFVGAHRDPHVFADPDRLDLRRDTRDVTIFGQGPHFCLGANVAQAELRLMIEAALDFLPAGAHVLENQVEWSGNATLRRIESLPVEFGR